MITLFFASPGLLDAGFLRHLLIVLPVAMISAYAGVRVFERLADKNFTILINGLLLLSALNLLAGIYL